MRTNNPVLSRPDAFTPAWQDQTTQTWGQPQQSQATWAPGGQRSGEWAPAWQEPVSQRPTPQRRGVMTVDDVLLKTFLLFVGLVIAAAASWLFIPLSLYLPVAIITGIITVATVFFVAGRRSVSLPLIGLYVVAEGVMLGTFSLLFETQYPGIVMPAVVATFVTAFAFLGVYKFLGVRISGRMAKIVTLAVIAYAVIAVLGLVLMLLGVNIGIFGIGPTAGPLAWLFAGIGVVLASASLFMDFQSIERGIEMGAPESESWRAAFGLVVTMVWLYTQIIRILSFFRD